MAVPADWYLDPTSRNERRYWDGSRWTNRVMDANGKEGVDPVASGQQRVDLADWAQPAIAGQTPSSGSPQAASGSSTRRRMQVLGPPSDRHKVVVGSSMLSGSLALAIVALVISFLPPLGPAAVVGGIVAVWFSLRGRSLIRGAGDLEVVGPSRNILLGMLAAIIGAVSSALFIAMLREGDVTIYVVCVRDGQADCTLQLLRAAAGRLGL